MKESFLISLESVVNKANTSGALHHNAQLQGGKLHKRSISEYVFRATLQPRNGNRENYDVSIEHVGMPTVKQEVAKRNFDDFDSPTVTPTSHWLAAHPIATIYPTSCFLDSWI